MKIRLEKADSPAARALIEALDSDLERRYPASPIFGIEAASFEDEGGVFAIGYHGKNAVVSGALRPREDAVEVKRVFVMPQWRRHGFAKAMMAFLEAEAANRGFKRILLETGSGQPEAIRLYRALGWSQIPPFGLYKIEGNETENSGPDEFRHVCFEKCLAVPLAEHVDAPHRGGENDGCQT